MTNKVAVPEITLGTFDDHRVTRLAAYATIKAYPELEGRLKELLDALDPAKPDADWTTPTYLNGESGLARLALTLAQETSDPIAQEAHFTLDYLTHPEKQHEQLLVQESGEIIVQAALF